MSLFGHRHSKGLARLTRTIQTANQLPYPKLQWKQLDELSSGSCDGLTYEEIEKQFPVDFAERDNDKCIFQ